MLIKAVKHRRGTGADSAGFHFVIGQWKGIQDPFWVAGPSPLHFWSNRCPLAGVLNKVLSGQASPEATSHIHSFLLNSERGDRVWFHFTVRRENGYSEWLVKTTAATVMGLGRKRALVTWHRNHRQAGLHSSKGCVSKEEFFGHNQAWISLWSVFKQWLCPSKHITEKEKDGWGSLPLSDSGAH